MTRLLRLACIAVALALATGAAAMVEALGAEGPGATQITAQERARQMRLQEARVQVKVAEEALHRAEYTVEEGLGSGEKLGALQLDLVRAERALAEAEAMEKRRSSVQLLGASLQEAFTAIFKDSDQSFMLHPDLAQLPYSITLNLKDVGLESAVQMICKLYNLEYETDNEGLWVIMPGSGFVTVAGARVPIIGTVTTLQGPQGGETELAPQDIRVFERRRGGGMGVIETPKRPSFHGENRLVDLDVESAPLSEVASRLSLKAVPPPKEGPFPPDWLDRYCNLVIIADDSVKDMKVTARITKWPLGDVLDMLLAQTGLVCTVDPAAHGSRVVATSFHIERDPVTGEQVHPPASTIRVYLVPAPEMRVSGAGLPFETPVSQRMAFARDAKDRADAVTALLALRECPKCHAAAIVADWKYCPKCGAKLPEAKQPAEKGAKGD